MNNILFIWIPKTAGTSMFNIFQEYGCQKLTKEEKYKNFNNQGFTTFGHMNIFDLISMNYISNEYFQNAYKIAFVRNPWDRLVSLYHYRKKNKYKITSKYDNFSDFVYGLEKRFQLREKILDKIFDRDFIKSNVSMDNFFSIQSKKLIEYIYTTSVNPIGFYDVRSLSQANPQVNWIVNDKGKLIVDFLGRFETLNEDFERLKKIIGIRGRLPKLRQTKHRNYRLYYTEKTKRIVENIYYKDMDYFNYQF